MTQDKFVQLGAELNGELEERTEEIRCALLALVAGCTFFMVGQPGIAKSRLARRMAARISGVRFFDAQLSMSSTPEVMFGPPNLKALKSGQWERVTEGTLVDADLVHLDEVFLASKGLLDGLNMALNERLYRHGTTLIALPYTTLLASANAIPTEPRFAAIWDRLLLRRVLAPVANPDAFVRMLQATPADKPEPVLSWAEVRQAQTEAAAVTVGEDVAKVVYELRRELAGKKVTPSDRRFVHAMGVVRAAAWLEGRDTAEIFDLSCLTDILWQFPEQITVVRQVTNRVLDSHIDPAVRLLNDLRALRSQIRDDLAGRARTDLAEELGGKHRALLREIETFEREALTFSTQRARSLAEEVGDEIVTRLFDGNRTMLEAPPHRRGEPARRRPPRRTGTR